MWDIGRKKGGFMDLLQISVSNTSEEIDVNDSSTAFEEIVVSEDVSAKYAEEIVAYEHGDVSEAIKKIFAGTWYCQIETKSLLEGSEVLRNQEDGSVVCSCQLFLRVGILCRHVFCVFKNANIEVIPSQYILRRWTKNLIPAALRNKRNRYAKVVFFVENLRLLKIDVEADCPNPPSKNKADNLEELVGVPKPAEKTVNNPALGNPKGRKKLRIKGGKEQALDKNSKNRNACSLCGETDGHNRRTCPKKFAEEAELDQAEVTIEGDLDQSEVTREADLDQAEVTS
ncbi:FAR1 DNA binding domain, Zinc finger, SWIM-type, MULE transposase domain, FHY3/FAR1 family [Artemisia annua]|uniref:FAR1 DNA binding domain, Zinc finger, SWIM-type, MULE transposase domain, FHY3/FAR1 family n=1 Tax=Artemisia annua TaxID=35608 RepID=A0A2U1NWT0_ARTAN|nr:FAR1 DNA binding domain, Zinc finger, SWIM-type, MULE transposase domain, FHY3/FAR1 family [Artemisia annua]